MKLIAWLFALILALELIYITLQNHYIPTSNYAALLAQITAIKRENLQLKTLLLHEESLQTINQKARSWGFIEAKYLLLK